MEIKDLKTYLVHRWLTSQNYFSLDQSADMKDQQPVIQSLFFRITVLACLDYHHIA